MAPVHLRLELNSTGSTIKRGREIFSFHSLNIGNVDVECELRIRAKASLWNVHMPFPVARWKPSFSRTEGDVYTSEATRWLFQINYARKTTRDWNSFLYQGEDAASIEPTCYFDYIDFFVLLYLGRNFFFWF